MRPSAGTEAPGRTTTTSPRTSSDGATVTTSPPTTFSASSGSSAANESMAEVVCARDHISIQWPSSMMTTSRASSHQKLSSWPRIRRLAPQEATKATVTASPIRSVIPGRQAQASATAPVRNGHPPHRYTTVPSSGETHHTHGASGSR